MQDTTAELDSAFRTEKKRNVCTCTLLKSIQAPTQKEMNPPRIIITPTKSQSPKQIANTYKSNLKHSTSQPSQGRVKSDATTLRAIMSRPKTRKKSTQTSTSQSKTRNNSSHLMHNHPDRRQALATLASPAHARERSAGTFAAVLDCGALCWRRSVSPNAVRIFCPRVGTLV
jgi:hypothetical protein